MFFDYGWLGVWMVLVSNGENACIAVTYLIGCTSLIGSRNELNILSEHARNKIAFLCYT